MTVQGKRHRLAPSGRENLGDHEGPTRRNGRRVDVEHPWSTRVDREIWRVRLNDFPDDYMYTLLIDDRDASSFLDWPQTWPGRKRWVFSSRFVSSAQVGRTRSACAAR
jgi:hypothetical protein